VSGMCTGVVLLVVSLSPPDRRISARATQSRQGVMNKETGVAPVDEAELNIHLQ